MEITFKGTTEEMAKLLIQVIGDSDKELEEQIVLARKERIIDCTAPRKPKD